MSAKTRRLVLMISAPVVAFAIIGGFLSKVTAREDTYPQLRIFQDVVQLITGSYVDPVNVDKVMTGAMHGLADSLDPDSAYLSADQVRQIETNAPQPTADVGLDLTRQYYLRVIAARDGSSAAKAGLRTGDYVRIIGDTPTREMSVYEGMRRLRGAPGTKISITVIRGSAADPHVIELTRDVPPTTDVTGGLPRRASAISVSPPLAAHG
jgi:carboxyl-terminal processing protease